MSRYAWLLSMVMMSGVAMPAISLAKEQMSDPASAAPLAAQGVAPKVVRMADRCSDFTTNGWGFKAPNNFLIWLDIFSDPSIWLEYAQRGLDPQTYVRTGNSLLEPAAVRNHLEWTDPMIYSKWLGASSTSDFYTKVSAILFEPERLMRWAMLPVEPRAWNILFGAANPETWMKWINAPADPRTQAFLNRAANPDTWAALIRELQDPKNYPGAYASLAASRAVSRSSNAAAASEQSGGPNIQMAKNTECRV